MVKRLWLGACLVVLAQPTIHMLLVAALATTLIAFMLLDETP